MKSLLFQLSITLFFLCAYTFSSQAQSNLNDDGGTHTITQTFIIFTLIGADGGEKGSGGGDGSFVSLDAVGFKKTVPERTTQVNDSKIEYQFYSACEVQINQVREHFLLVPALKYSPESSLKK